MSDVDKIESVDELWLNIGALSQATAIPVNTIRTWERRYGRPQARRTDTGQRLYPPNEVEYLKLVRLAMDKGLRAAQVLTASPDRLIEMLGSHVPGPAASPASRSTDFLTLWLNAARALDEEALMTGFRTELGRLGLFGFVHERAAPFLREVGEAWHAGELHPFQEHFATERLRDFLTDIWRPMSEPSRGNVGICALLPGERHGLGLHMAASILSLYGWRLIFLGGETPLADLVECARQTHANAVFLSVSVAAPPETRWHVETLRDHLPDDIELVVGGMGAPEGIFNVRALKALPDLLRWVTQGGDA
jgi:methanogenic corrinoid protein MtbC1